MNEILTSDRENRDKFIESIEKKLKTHEEKIIQYQNTRKNSERKIEELKIQEKALVDTLRTLEEDNQDGMMSKNMKISTHYSEVCILLNHLPDLNPGQNEIKLLYLIGTLCDLSENTQIIQNTQTVIQTLQEVMNSNLPTDKYNTMNEDLSGLSPDEISQEFKSVYFFLTALQQRNVFLRSQSSQIEKTEILAAEISQIQMSILNETKLQNEFISLLESESSEYKTLKLKYSTTQPILTHSESFQTDVLINLFHSLSQRTQESYERACYLEKNCIGDAIMSCVTICYLGIVEYDFHELYRGVVHDLLVKNSVAVSDIWKERSLEVSRYYKEVCDVSILEERVLSDMTLQTISLMNHLSPKNFIYIDYTGEIKSVLFNYYAIYNTSSRKDGYKLNPPPQHPYILEDYAINYDTDSDLGWQPGPGLSTPFPSFDRIYTQAQCPIGVIASKSKLYFNQSILQESLVLSGELNLETCYDEIFKILIQHIDLAEFNAIIALEQQIKELKSYLKSLEEKFEAYIFSSAKDSSLNSDFLQQVFDLSNETKDVTRKLAAYESGYNDICSSYSCVINYSKLIVHLYSTLLKLGKIIGDCVYTWKTCKRIITLTLAKTIRDISASHPKEDKEESQDHIQVDYNEEFFKNNLLPALWIVISSGIQHEHLCLYSLLFSIHLALEDKKLSTKEVSIFNSVFLQQSGATTWKRDFPIKHHQQGRWEVQYQDLEHLILSNFPEASSCMESLRFHIEASDYDITKVSSSFKNVLEKSKHKELGLFLRVIMSVHFPSKLSVRLLRQFIFTTLNAYFDYHEDMIKLHTFIKTASWSIPIALYSTPGMNIVNTVCSLANFYGVGLEVIRTDPEGDEDGKGTNIDTIELLSRCAEDGTWVLVSTSKFPSFWEDVIMELDMMRSQATICNTFRVFFDLQGLRSFEIPDLFLKDNCIRFYMSEENMEDLEGFNDVWNNILNEDIVRVEGPRTVETTFLSRHSFSIHR